MGLGCEVHKEVMMEERKVFGKGGGSGIYVARKLGGKVLRIVGQSTKWAAGRDSLGEESQPPIWFEIP